MNARSYIRNIENIEGKVVYVISAVHQSDFDGYIEDDRQERKRHFAEANGKKWKSDPNALLESHLEHYSKRVFRFENAMTGFDKGIDVTVLKVEVDKLINHFVRHIFSAK